MNSQSVSDLYDMLHDYYANAAVEMGAEKLPNDDLKDIEQAGATLRIQPERTDCTKYPWARRRNGDGQGRAWNMLWRV
jgi:hypothetical protein